MYLAAHAWRALPDVFGWLRHSQGVNWPKFMYQCMENYRAIPISVVFSSQSGFPNCNTKWYSGHQIPWIAEWGSIVYISEYSQRREKWFMWNATHISSQFETTFQRCAFYTHTHTHKQSTAWAWYQPMMYAYKYGNVEERAIRRNKSMNGMKNIKISRVKFYAISAFMLNNFSISSHRTVDIRGT